MPLMDPSGLTVPLPDPALAEDATVVLGCLDAEVVRSLKRLKWIQAWSAGVDFYLRPGNFPDGAALLNAGRDSAVDPDALLDALRSGKLWGAGLDVTEPEPLPPIPPCGTSQTCCSPPMWRGSRCGTG